MKKKIKPSECLDGMIINNQWEIVRKAAPDEITTGGRYTQGYIVKRDSEIAWLKALDWSEVLQVSEDPAKVIEQVLASYNYEADLHKFCLSKGFKNVVRILDSGKVVLEDFPTLPVFYLVLEKGKYDIRNEMKEIKRFDYYWVFRAVHQIALGIGQLHSRKIVHQDIKPSNIIAFNDEVKKIGDLGSACSMDEGISESKPKHVESKIPGTYQYAPPELLYGEINPDWDIRRKSCDLYQLGSIIVFFLIKRHMTDLIKSHLHYSLHWDRDNNIKNYRSVIDYVKQAFDRAIDEISLDINDEYLKKEIIPVIRQLCDPEPENRGHPKSFREIGSNYSLTRYITIFARIYKHFRYSRKK